MFRYLKKIFCKVKKVDAAVVRYTKISRIPAMPYRAFLNFADYFFVTGCFEQAEELLKSAENFVSSSSDAIVNLGALKQTTGDFDTAIEYYKKALKKDSKNTRALCYWGNCLSFKKDIDGAIDKYKKAIAIDKNYAEGYLCWGINLLKKNDYNKAREKFKTAAEYNKKDARALFMLASVEIELGLYDEALPKLEFIADSTEGNVGAYHNIAYIYFKKKDYENTIKYAKQAISIMPFKLESYLLLGDTYSLIEENDKAIEAYQQAENNNIKSAFLYISWGSLMQKNNNHNAAIEKFQKGIELDSKNDELYTRLAESYYAINDIENAKFNLEKVFEITKDNPFANRLAADICILENRNEQALEYLKNCSNNADIKPLVYHSYAKYYKAIGDIKQAEKNYEKAIEYDKENAELLLEYVNYLNDNGIYEKANKKLLTLENLLKDDFDMLSLAFKVNYNLAKENIYGYNKVKAIQVAEKIKEKYPEKFIFEDEYIELKGIKRE